jgi:hypothetical protein
MRNTEGYIYIGCRRSCTEEEPGIVMRVFIGLQVPRNDMTTNKFTRNASADFELQIHLM